MLEKVLVAAVVVATLCSAGSCGGDEEVLVSPSPRADSNLSSDELSALRDLADETASAGNLRPAVPLYIPQGLARFPAEVHPSTTSVAMTFGAARTEAQPTPILLVIYEDLEEHDPVSGNTTELGGVLATVESGRGISEEDPDTPENMYYSLSFVINDRYFSVELHWETPSGELSSEMKLETERTARSVIDDFRQEV